MVSWRKVALVGLAVSVLCVAVWLFGGAWHSSPAEAPGSPDKLVTGFADAPNINAAFYALNEAAADNPAALRKAALARLADKNPDTHYAALYALVMTADADNGAAELAAMLTSPNADERLLSAGALAGLGDKRALPVLIAALDQQDKLSYRAPPQRACDFAQRQLLWFTNQDFGLKAARTNEQIAATKPDWERWWQVGSPTIHFDPHILRFVE